MDNSPLCIYLCVYVGSMCMSCKRTSRLWHDCFSCDFFFHQRKARIESWTIQGSIMKFAS